MNYKTNIYNLVGFIGGLVIACTHFGTNLLEERNIFDKYTLPTFEEASRSCLRVKLRYFVIFIHVAIVLLNYLLYVCL